MSQPYHKILKLYRSIPEGKKNAGKADVGNYSMPEFGYLAKNVWQFTEKVDGTNIRIGWNPFTGEVEFAGRTDSAVISKPLLEYLRSTFSADLFFSAGLLGRITLFGEGYGPNIHGGGKYNSDHSFVLFDIVSNSDTIEEWNINHLGRQNVIPNDDMSHEECVSLVIERSSEPNQSFEKSGTDGLKSIETLTSNENIILAKPESGTLKTSLESLSKSTRNCLTCKMEFVPFASSQKLQRAEMETLLHSPLTTAMIHFVLEAYCAEDVTSAFNKLTNTQAGLNRQRNISHNWWLSRDNVNDVGVKLGIDTVPVIWEGPLLDGVDLVRSGFVFNDRGGIEKFGHRHLRSAWGDFEAEGVVARPKVDMFDRGGRRIIAKIRGRDFK